MICWRRCPGLRRGKPNRKTARPGTGVRKAADAALAGRRPSGAGYDRSHPGPGACVACLTQAEPGRHERRRGHFDTPAQTRRAPRSTSRSSAAHHAAGNITRGSERARPRSRGVRSRKARRPSHSGSSDSRSSAGQRDIVAIAASPARSTTRKGAFLPSARNACGQVPRRNLILAGEGQERVAARSGLGGPETHARRAPASGMKALLPADADPVPHVKGGCCAAGRGTGMIG